LPPGSAVYSGSTASTALPLTTGTSRASSTSGPQRVRSIDAAVSDAV